MLEKGVPRHPDAGRKAGVLNKTTSQIKQAYADLLEKNIPKLEEWLERVALKNPEKALDLHIEISKRFVPTLQAIKIEGEINHVMQPPQISKILDITPDATASDNDKV